VQVLESRKIAEKTFAELYPKFVSGGRWLDAQIAAKKDVRKDTDDFLAIVILPLRDVYLAFDAAQRQAADAAMLVFDAFPGKHMQFFEVNKKGGIR
jgi:hypothetical protein